MQNLDYQDIVIAVNRVNGWRDGFEIGRFEATLAAILEEDRLEGSFNGTIASALRCFERQGYNVRHLLKLYQETGS